MDTIKTILGRNVRHYRNRIGLSQDELARLVGISKGSVQLLESGKVWPEYENLSAIAQALGVSEFAFIDDTPKAQVAPTPEEALAVLAKAISSRGDSPTNRTDAVVTISDLPKGVTPEMVRAEIERLGKQLSSNPGVSVKVVEPAPTSETQHALQDLEIVGGLSPLQRQALDSLRQLNDVTVEHFIRLMATHLQHGRGANKGKRGTGAAG